MAAVKIQKENFQREVMESDKPCSWISGPAGAARAAWWVPS